jgi:hypothetical protein
MILDDFYCEANSLANSARIKNCGAIPPIAYKFSRDGAQLIKPRDSFTLHIQVE